MWAARTEVLQALGAEELQAVIRDFTQSRDAGIKNIPSIVQTWSPRLNLSPYVLENYLTRNIHYFLDQPAVAGIERFFADAFQLGLMAQIPALRWADAPSVLR